MANLLNIERYTTNIQRHCGILLNSLIKILFTRLSSFAELFCEEFLRK